MIPAVKRSGEWLRNQTQRLPMLRRGQPQPIQQEITNHSISSPKVLETTRRLKAFEDSFTNYTPPKDVIMSYFGNDHWVGKVTINNKPYALKKLKPTSRENVILGLGVKPEEYERYRLEHSRVISEGGVVNILEVAQKMRAMHAVVTAHLNEELGNVIVPTAIIVRDNEIYRIQPWIPHRSATGADMQFELSQQLQFYDTKLMPKWRNMLLSSDFYQLPEDVQRFYKYFGLDHFEGTNAIFRDLITPPRFMIIDY